VLRLILNMKKLYLLIAMFLLLLGCATQENYKKELTSWMGLSEDQLIIQWGIPIGSYVMNDGYKILTYQASGSYALPGTSVIDPMTGFPKMTQGPTVLTNCITRFKISPSGEIVGASAKGNNCKSY